MTSTATWVTFAAILCWASAAFTQTRPAAEPTIPELFGLPELPFILRTSPAPTLAPQPLRVDASALSRLYAVELIPALGAASAPPEASLSFNHAWSESVSRDERRLIASTSVAAAAAVASAHAAFGRNIETVHRLSGALSQYIALSESLSAAIKHAEAIRSKPDGPSGTDSGRDASSKPIVRGSTLGALLAQPRIIHQPKDLLQFTNPWDGRPELDELPEQWSAIKVAIDFFPFEAFGLGKPAGLEALRTGVDRNRADLEAVRQGTYRAPAKDPSTGLRQWADAQRSGQNTKDTLVGLSARAATMGTMLAATQELTGRLVPILLARIEEALQTMARVRVFLREESTWLTNERARLDTRRALLDHTSKGLARESDAIAKDRQLVASAAAALDVAANELQKTELQRNAAEKDLRDLELEWFKNSESLDASNWGCSPLQAKPACSAKERTSELDARKKLLMRRDALRLDIRNAREALRTLRSAVNDARSKVAAQTLGVLESRIRLTRAAGDLAVRAQRTEVEWRQFDTAWSLHSNDVGANAADAERLTAAVAELTRIR